jgi:hypothetical protein
MEQLRPVDAKLMMKIVSEDGRKDSTGKCVKKSVKDDGGLLSSLSLPVRRGVTVQRILTEDCRIMQPT